MPHPGPPQRRWTRALECGALGAALFATAWVYRRVPRVYFFADDLICLFKIATQGALRFVFEPFAGHVLVARNAVLAATYALFGFHPEPFQWMAFLVHLANVALLFRVVRRCTASPAAALLAAALWGTCPLHAGTLGWYSVFGQVMGVALTLLVLDRVTLATMGGARPLDARHSVLAALALLVATTSFGTGFATALLAPVLIFGFDPEAWRAPTVRRVVLAIPLLAGATFAALHLGWMACCGQTGADRVVAARTANADLWITAEMIGRMLVSGSSALLLGFTEPRPRAPEARAFLAAAAAATLLVLGLVRARPAARRWIFSALTLTVGVDGAIALSRSGIYVAFGRELATAAAQARYHYASSVTLALALAIAFDAVLGGQTSRAPSVRAPRWSWVAVAVVAVLSVVTYRNSTFELETRWIHRGWVDDAFAEIERRRVEAGNPQPFFVENEPVPSWMLGPAFDHPSFPGVAALWLVRAPGPMPAPGEPRFVEANPWLTRIARSLAETHPRFAVLLATPDEAAGQPVARLPEAQRAKRAFEPRSRAGGATSPDVKDDGR